MTFKEAALRIKDHMIVHKMAEHPHAIKITEALEMAVKLLLWIDEQPEFILEGNIIDLINEYHESGCRVGFNRAKKEYSNVLKEQDKLRKEVERLNKIIEEYEDREVSREANDYY